MHSMVIETVDGITLVCDPDPTTEEEVSQAADYLTEKWNILRSLRVSHRGLPTVVAVDKIIAIHFIKIEESQ